MGAPRAEPAAPLELYRRELVRRGLASRTIAQRVGLMRRLRRFLDRSPITATEEDIQAFLDYLRVGMSTRSIYLASFASFYKWARKAGYVRVDPVEDIVRPRLPRRLPRPMPKADLEWALRGADARMRAWLLLAAYEGLRCCEIATLRVENIRDNEDPPFIEVVGKGGHERKIPLNPMVEEALRAYGLPQSGYVFVSPRTRMAYRQGTVSNVIASYLRGKGLRWTAHNGRHSFGTEVNDATGGDLRIVQELMGHASPATTALYTRVNQEKAVQAVRSLGARRTPEPAKLPGFDRAER